MDRRLFSRDPSTGITKWFHYDDVTDEVTIHTQQDNSELVERNKRLQSEQTRLERWGDGKCVAHVPLTVYMEWVKEGKDKDQAFIRRWLNDPENRMHRTFLGKV